jgi:hypothetical protein
MIGTTRSRVNFFMNKFKRLGFIKYNGGLPLGSFAAALLIEIETDRQVLQELAERVGSSSSQSKDMVAWQASFSCLEKFRFAQDG